MLTQEEQSKITYWALSPRHIPTTVIEDLLEDASTRNIWIYPIKFILEYMFVAETDYNGVQYYYCIADPWCWSRPTTEAFILKLATNQLKVEHRIDHSDNICVISDKIEVSDDLLY